MSSTTFVDACLAGDALAHDIDDWVDRWHDDDVPDTSLSLDEFLGFTHDEGRLWAEKPESLGMIIYARHRRVPVIEIVVRPDEFDLAARSESVEVVQDVFQWLVERGRIRADLL